MDREVSPFSSGIVTANVIARRTSDGSPKAFRIVAAIHRASTGNSTVLILSNTSVPAGGPLSAAAATIDSTNGNFRVRVTGIAGTEIAWGLWYEGGRLVHATP